MRYCMSDAGGNISGVSSLREGKENYMKMTSFGSDQVLADVSLMQICWRQ